MKSLLVGLLVLPIGMMSQGTNDSLGFEFSAFIETYYAKDDIRFSDQERPGFLYNNTLTDQLAINLAFLRGAWQDKRTRACLGLMSGTYAERNLASEPAIFRNVLEAWGGVSLDKEQRTWLDAGIFPSHIGMESAAGSFNMTVSRSLAAENSPYYESGVRLMHVSSSGEWSMALLGLNGWQRIRKLPGRYGPAAGMQLVYRKGTSLLVNYSNYIGDQDPGEDFGARMFQNLYATWTPTKALSFSGSFDIGFQPKFQSGQDDYGSWYAWYGVVCYRPTAKFAVAARYENYTDQHEIIVDNTLDAGFIVDGISCNIDYLVSPLALLRVEFRRLFADKMIILDEESQRKNSLNGLNVSFSVYMNKRVK